MPDPQPGPEQVLIKVEAAGMNPMHRTIGDGGLKEMMPASFPLVVMTVTAPPRRRGPCYE